MADIKRKWAPVEVAVSQVYDGLNDPEYNQPPQLDGNPPEAINRVGLQAVGSVACMTMLGYGLDLGAPHLMTGGRKAWSIMLMFSSYVLLIPGITSVLFSFNILVNAFGHRISLQPDGSHKSCTESTAGLVHLLSTTGSTVGAALVILYAMVVPVVKLVLIALGEAMRSSRSRARLQIARSCILAVQVISKWASPDMFAYILLVHLVRGLEDPPNILTAARLDVGFSCFSVFCVCSTVSSLGIALPPLPRAGERKSGEAPRLPPQSSPAARAALAMWSLVLAAAFAVLFHVGLSLPCMSFQVVEENLYSPHGNVPASMKPMVEALALPELLHSDVSVLGCTLSLLAAAGRGEVSSALALCMLAIFAIGLTVLDMMVLVGASLRLWWAEDPAGPKACPCLAASRVLKKLSMLDVCTMGVYVVSFCLAIYREDGIVVSTERGVTFLLAAEVVHSVAYYTVFAFMKQAGTEDAEDTAECGAEAHCDASADTEVPCPSFSLVCCGGAASKGARPHGPPAELGARLHGPPAALAGLGSPPPAGLAAKGSPAR